MKKCLVCQRPNASNPAPSLLTAEEQARVDAYYASFQDKDGKPIYHTGHLRPELMELPTALCDEHKDITPDEIRKAIELSTGSQF